MSVRRGVALALVLASAQASAVEPWDTGIDGVGRISVSGGWKLAGQDWFFRQSADQGHPTVTRGIGGPQGFASFGYGAIRWLEVSIDLFMGHDRFEIGGFNPINILTYGALVGARATFMDFLFPGFAPYVGVSLGPVLGYVWTGASNETFERLITGVAGVAGLSYRVTERFALFVDYRFLYARGVWVTSGLNVGGSFFSLGFTFYFPRSPSVTSGMLGGL